MMGKKVVLILVLMLVVCLLPIDNTPIDKSAGAEPELAVPLISPTFVGEIQITTDLNGQSMPNIWKDIIAWRDTRSGVSFDIYGYNLLNDTEFAICTDPLDQLGPIAISEEFIIWNDIRNGGGNSDIYGYNLTNTTEFPLVTDPLNQGNADIFEDIVVYVDVSSGNADIHLYNLSNGTNCPLTTHLANQSEPAIYGDIVVYRDDRNEATTGYDIYAYNISNGTEFPVCVLPETQDRPKIWGDMIVWEDGRWSNFGPFPGNWEIFGYDLKTGQEIQITDNTTDIAEMLPDIWGQRVVWSDYLAGLNIRAYCFWNDTSFPIIINSSREGGNPAIYGNKIVYAANRTDKPDADIYMYVLPSEPPIPKVSSPEDGAVFNSTDIIDFDASGTIDWDGDVLSYWWESNLCGSIGSGAKFSRTLPYGYHTIRLWVNDSHGNNVSAGVFNVDCRGGAMPPEFVGKVQITTNTSGQSDPDIWGDIIVWEDWRNGNKDIYAYNISNGTEFAVCTALAYQDNPTVHGNIIVWRDARNDDGDIYAYNLSSEIETRITTDSSFQGSPAIYEDKIVWHDDRNGNKDIYIYSLLNDTKWQLTNHLANQTFPAIYGDIVVYQDDRNDATTGYDIYAYNISNGTEFPVCVLPETQDRPKIWGDMIIWEDGRGTFPGPFPNNWDIFGYYISNGTEIQITTDIERQMLPDIWGQRVVWEDGRKGPASDLDIWAYCFWNYTEFQITTNDSGQSNPAIYGNKIVYSDGRNGNGDIYMYVLPSEPPIPKIDSPEESDVFDSTDSIYFDCHNSSDLDGDVLSFYWESNITGCIGQGSRLTSSLAFGNHEITLWVNDGHGNNESAIVNITVNNMSPTAVIDSPEENDVFNSVDNIYFDGYNSSDPDDDILSFYWESNLTGSIGFTSRFTTYLPYGEHQITLWVDDGNGHNVSAVVNITVENSPPMAVIDSPDEFASYESTDTIYFDGYNSSDPDDDILTFCWEANVTGYLSNESRFNATLPKGKHQITLWVNDSHGHNVSTSVNINVDNVAPPMTTPVSPDNNTWINFTTPTLVCNSVIDYDGDTVYYRFAISTLPDETGTVIYSGWQTDTSWTPILSNGTWYWRAYTNDLYLTTNPDWYRVVNVHVTGPVIVHTPIEEANVGDEITVTAIVTDDVGVDAVQLHYQDVGNTTYTSIEMNPTGNANEYSAIIPAQGENGVVHYYIWVNDTNNNIATTQEFTVLITGDIVLPEVLFVEPTGTNVSVATGISIVFSEPMNMTTVQEAITIIPNVTISEYIWSSNNRTLTVIFSANLSYNTTYNITIGTRAVDVAGNGLVSVHNWEFTTREKPLEIGHHDDGIGNYWLIVLLIVIVLIVTLQLLRRKQPEDEDIEKGDTEMEVSE
ncbi:MAG: Ig-like domain-containing protein [Thermoplasmata archaeon]|nr:Ig-like domain-containing protein [Thermoplasmata archaeon]